MQSSWRNSCEEREADCVSRPNPKICFGPCDYLLSPVISGANPQPKDHRVKRCVQQCLQRGRRALTSYSGRLKMTFVIRTTGRVVWESSKETMFTQMTPNSPRQPISSHQQPLEIWRIHGTRTWHPLQHNSFCFTFLNASTLGKEGSGAWRQGGVRGQAN